ncbi:MAG: BON domain-containing protein [Thermodesulfobacteriota bacterium]
MRWLWMFCGVLALLPALAGCGAVVGGAVGVGGYKTATDERTMGTQLDDAKLAVEVKSLLIEDTTIAARRIDVDVIDRHAYLTGVVATREQAARAEEIAAGVKGIAGVSNRLHVGIKTLSRSWDDTVIASKINASLLREPSVRSFNIDVDVVFGEVSLLGVVDSEATRARVVEITRATPGVVKVNDGLTISR